MNNLTSKSKFLAFVVGLCSLSNADSAGLVIFGIQSTIEPWIGTISLVIIVVAVLCTEMFFHHLHKITHDTPFDTMVVAIEKELMIVGCMAFIFKIILQTAHIDHMWVLGLEFADMLVPITSFCVCFIGICLIVMSLYVVRQWVKAYHLHVFELLELHYLKAHSWWNRGRFSHFPISPINSQMEFRVFHSIFCENYNIHKGAFAFDQYVYRKFEKSLLKILHINETKWMIVIVIGFLDYLRYYLKFDIHACVRNHVEDSQRRRLGGGSIDEAWSYGCLGKASIDNFTIAGITLFGFCLVMAVYSRIFELRLMLTRGVESSDDYGHYLMVYEEEHSKDEVAAVARMSEKDLKNAVEHASAGRNKLKNKGRFISNNREDGLLSKFFQLLKYLLEALFALLAKVFKREVQVSQTEILEHEHFTMKLAQEAIHNAEEARIAGTKQVSVDASVAAMKGAGKLLRRVKINRISKAIEIEQYVDTKKGTLKAREDYSNIFLFKSPAAYFWVVEVMIMPIALYLGMWITNYAVSAKSVAHGDTSLHVRWALQTFIPGFLSIFLYMYIVRTSSLLSSVTTFDNDSMLETIEQTDGTRLLGISMRDSMLAKLHAMGDPETQLKVLFDEIDDNGSNLLSRNEFQIFSEALGLTFSRKKWSQIFVEIDLNNDDEISFKELFLFLFPDNDTAKAEEIRRLKMKGLDAKAAANSLSSKLNSGKSEVEHHKLGLRAKQMADSMSGIHASDSMNLGAAYAPTASSESADLKVEEL